MNKDKLLKATVLSAYVNSNQHLIDEAQENGYLSRDTRLRAVNVFADLLKIENLSEILRISEYETLGWAVEEFVHTVEELVEENKKDNQEYEDEYDLLASCLLLQFIPEEYVRKNISVEDHEKIARFTENQYDASVEHVEDDKFLKFIIARLVKNIDKAVLKISLQEQPDSAVNPNVAD